LSSGPPYIFVATVEAVAGPENDVPDGRKYSILAFVEAGDEAAAGVRAERELTETGWIDIEVLRCGEVTDEAAVPADFVQALETARRWGCGLIVYEEP
jgi:hypothetical protein